MIICYNDVQINSEGEKCYGNQPYEIIKIKGQIQLF